MKQNYKFVAGGHIRVTLYWAWNLSFSVMMGSQLRKSICKYNLKFVLDKIFEGKVNSIWDQPSQIQQVSDNLFKSFVNFLSFFICNLLDLFGFILSILSIPIAKCFQFCPMIGSINPNSFILLLCSLPAMCKPYIV